MREHGQAGKNLFGYHSCKWALLRLVHLSQAFLPQLLRQHNIISIILIIRMDTTPGLMFL